MYRLVFQNRDSSRPPFVGRENTTTIGRGAACTLPLAEAGISDRHAAIERRADGLYIRDLDSATGVRVNGQRVTEQRLATGDEIELGSVRATFEIVHEPPPDRRAFDPWQGIAVGVVALLVAGQVALFGWIFSQEHPRRGRTDIMKGTKQQQQQAKAASNDAVRVLAPLPATEAPAAPASEVLNRMIKITRVDRTDAPDSVTLRIQVKAQVGERSIEASAVAVSVQCSGVVTWLPVPADWDNFTSRTLTARLSGACPGYVVRTYYRQRLQDEVVSH